MSRLWLGWVCLCLGLVTAPTALAASSDTFIVDMAISAATDSTAPTTPTNLVVTTISSSQLNLTWDAAADNVAVTGYQVWRDGAQIATTTSTNYADTGLSANTLYTYYVKAFDAAFNLSSSSLSKTGVTLDNASQTSETSGTRVPTASVLSIDNLQVDTTTDTAAVSFTTTRPAQVTYRWGRTDTFELGYSMQTSMAVEHNTNIDGLESGVHYFLEIIASPSYPKEPVRKIISFTTDSRADHSAPSNVTNLSAIVTSDGVALSWNNPTESDFSYVRIVSSDQFYPSGPSNGWYVYEGDAASAVDTRELTQPRFYSVFTFDKAGNRSSGAVVAIAPGSGLMPEYVDTPTGTDDVQKLLPALQLLQDGIVINAETGVVPAIDGTKPLTFSLPTEVVPAHLKSIVVTLKRTEGELSFLLTQNADSDAYEATVAPLQQSGTYGVQIALYDFFTQTIRREQGELIVFLSSANEAVITVETIVRVNWVALLALLVIVSLVVLYVYRRRG